jgi:hypothetical protein
MKLGRKTAKTDFAIAVRSHGEGLVSPATAVQDRDRSWLALDLRRTFKGHELQYSNQINAQKRVLSPRMPSINVREESLRYTFSPRHLPQLSAAQTWISQRSNGKREYEEDLRLAMNKGIKRLSLGFAYLRGTRFDEFAFRPLWERAGLIGDAGIEFQKGRRLTVHYESSELMLRNTPQLLNMESVQVGTRMAYWQDRVAFMPAADYRHQRDSRGLLDMSLFNFALSVLLKMPRCVPASDLMISITARRLSAVSLPDQNTAGLILQWNLKRL